MIATGRIMVRSFPVAVRTIDRFGRSKRGLGPSRIASGSSTTLRLGAGCQPLVSAREKPKLNPLGVRIPIRFRTRGATSRRTGPPTSPLHTSKRLMPHFARVTALATPCEGYYGGVLCRPARVDQGVDFAVVLGGGSGSRPPPPLISLTFDLRGFPAPPSVGIDR
jgi:hypothetical protein